MQDSFGHLHTQRCRLRAHGHFNSPHRNIHQKNEENMPFFYFFFFLSGIFLSTSSPFSHKILLKPAQKEAVVWWCAKQQPPRLKAKASVDGP